MVKNLIFKKKKYTFVYLYWMSIVDVLNWVNSRFVEYKYTILNNIYHMC